MVSAIVVLLGPPSNMNEMEGKEKVLGMKKIDGSFKF